MEPDDNRSWDTLIAGLRAGDDRVSSEFYARYGPLLEKVASGHLESRLLRRVAPEDVAHSVCRTFLRRVQRGNFELESGDNLWRLLCAITVAKARKKAHYHLAGKRAVDREARSSHDPIDSLAFELADAGPSPAEAAEFVDTFRNLLEKLGEEERPIVCMKLEGRTQEEIADACDCAERTVRRILKRVEEHLADRFLHDHDL